eukprot:3656557-Rhodomonas_salina.1
MDLAKNGGQVSDNYKNLMKFEIKRAQWAMPCYEMRGTDVQYCAVPGVLRARRLWHRNALFGQ